MSLPNITLAEFNKIASGSYNAGQVDFKKNSSGEFTGELVKINNHVVFKSKNNVHLTGDRVVAIKEAFLNALQKANVSDASLQEIRKELGLTGELDDKADQDTALLVKRYTPLTRDQIRKMLDNYAEKGRGFDGGQGVATLKEIRKAERTRNMSDSNKLDRDNVNRTIDGTVTDGRDNSVLQAIKLMTGASLDTINKSRMDEITGENAVNRRGESKTILANSFTALYSQMLKLLDSNESDEFMLLGQTAKLVKGDNGNISVLLNKGGTKTQLNIGKTAEDIIFRMIGQAVNGKPLLGNKLLQGMLEATYARDMEGLLAAGDRTSLSRQFASIVVVRASEMALEAKEAAGEPRNPEDSVRFDDICGADYDTECLIDVALNAIVHGEKVATKAALDDFYGHIREFNSSLSTEMKDMLKKVLDLPIQKPVEGAGMMEVSLVKNPDEILKKMDVGGKPLNDAVKPADVADVKNFVADMVYSDDMLFMELSDDVNAGAKMREALAAPGRATALAEIITNPDILECAVSPTIADVVKGGMQKFIAILDAAFKAANNGDSLADAAKQNGFAARLAEFIADATKISDNELAKLPMIMQSMAIKGCEKLQTFINEVFNIDTKAQNAAGGLTTEPYKDKSANQIKAELENKTLDQIRNDASQAESASPGQIGLFKQVLGGYFTGMGRADKKTIFAAALKYADTFDFRNLEGKEHDEALTKATSKFVGAILKGTSPLMQKMMQGMPKSIMGKFSEALDDMKSKLAPIPRKIVQAHLLKMIEDGNEQGKRYNREIKGIEIKKSLGAASVGEAFLCTIKYTEKKLAPNPSDPFGDQIMREYEYKNDVVIKIMRPDAEERVKREAEVFTEAAKKIGQGMSATWEGQYNQYKTEFDFTNEAKNVSEGEDIYDVADKFVSPYKAIAPSLRSMTLNDIIATTKNAMVCNLVKGETIDRIASKARKDVDKMFGKIFVTDQKTGKPKQVKGKNDKNTLVLREDAKPQDVLMAKANAEKIYTDLIDMQKKLMQAGKVWFSEALLASGKFHGDAHAGNLMYSNTGVKESDGITFIDFGNLYQLKTNSSRLDEEGKPVNERVELLRLILGATLRNEKFVLQSVERLLSPAGRAALAANREKAEAAIQAINDKGNFSFHACYRLEAILSELQKLGLELPPQINCFIQSMTRMQNMFAETNNMLAEIRTGLIALKDCKFPEEVELDEHDLIGKSLLKMYSPEGKKMVQDIDENGEPKFVTDENDEPTDVQITEKSYIVDIKRLIGPEGILAEGGDTGFTDGLMKRIRDAEDKEAVLRSLWDKLTFYHNAKKEEYDDTANDCIKALNNALAGKYDVDETIKLIVRRYKGQVAECLETLMHLESQFEESMPELPASFAQVIMTVLFSSGAATKNMFEQNFSGGDKGSLFTSAKSISHEIGGSFFEFPGTTINRLVKGAKVLGENDDKRTNVDEINLNDDNNQIELEV